MTAFKYASYRLNIYGELQKGEGTSKLKDAIIETKAR